MAYQNPLIIQSIEDQLAKLRAELGGKQEQLQKIQASGYGPQEQVIFNSAGDVMPKDIYPSIQQPSAEEQRVQGSLYEMQGGTYNPQTQGYDFTPPDQEDIYQKTMGRFQDEITALDQYYAQKKSELTQQLAQKSYGELGQQRAILAGSGQLGQVTGAAQKAGLQEQQSQRLKAGIEGIEAEQAYKKSTLFGQVRDMAQTDYQSKMDAISKGAESYLKYLGDKRLQQQDNINNVIQTALANDINLGNSNDSWLVRYAQELNVKPGDISSAYNVAKKDWDTKQLEAQQKAEKEAMDMQLKQAELDQKNYNLSHPDIKSEINTDTGRVLLINKETGTTIRDYGVVPEKEGGTAGTTISKDAQAKIDDSNYVISQMDKLTQLWNNVPDKYKGYFQGRATNILGSKSYSKEVAEFESAKSLVGMALTRLFEKGVISDKDREFYLSQMPNLTQSTTEVVKTSADAIKEQLEQKVKALQGNIEATDMGITGQTSSGLKYTIEQ